MTTYPLTNQQLLETINGSAQQGQGFNSVYGLLQQLGYNTGTVKSQLLSAGYSSSQITKIMTSTGSELTRILNAIGSSAIPGPGLIGGKALLEGEGAAGGAEAGGAAGGAEGAAAGGGAGSLLNAASKILPALTVGALFAEASTWKGLGLMLAGGLLVLLGLFQMAGRSLPSVVPV